MLRRARDTNGQKLADVASGTVEGLPISYVQNPAFPATTAALVGDFSMAVLGVRTDLRYKLLDQAVITDDDGAVIYNLPQQDMLALRVMARFAFATANPTSHQGDGYPFALLADAGM